MKPMCPFRCRTHRFRCSSRAGLSRIHKTNILRTKVISSQNLQTENSGYMLLCHQREALSAPGSRLLFPQRETRYPLIFRYKVQQLHFLCFTCSGLIQNMFRSNVMIRASLHEPGAPNVFDCQLEKRESHFLCLGIGSGYAIHSQGRRGRVGLH